MIEQVNSIEQMEYIETVVSLYIPDPTPIDPIETIPATEEEIERAKNELFGMSECARIFKDRYNSNALTKRFTYKDYIRHDEINEFVRDLELDADKFWLLIRFAYDYCKDKFRRGVTMKLSPLEQIKQLLEMIELAGNNNMSLNFKAGKLKTEIDSPDAIRYIAKAISNAQTDIQELKRLNHSEKADESVILSYSPLIAYFAKMLLAFFDTQPQIRNKRKKGASHSQKEIELVSRLVYFTGMSDGKGWKEVESDCLKAFLKQYKNYKYPNNTNRIYPAFYF